MTAPYSQELAQTWRERRRSGWAAVAPELEPYLDSQRWPSGAPLPDPIQALVSKRRRVPSFVPHISILATLALLYVPCAMLCAVIIMHATRRYHGRSSTYSVVETATCVYDIVEDRWGITHATTNVFCGTAFEAVAVAMCASLLVAYGLFRANRAVEQHVNCLYLLYAVHQADPEVPRDLVHKFVLLRLGMVCYIFGDGTYEMLPIMADRNAGAWNLMTASGRGVGRPVLPRGEDAPDSPRAADPLVV